MYTRPNVHLFPDLRVFWVLDKTALQEVCVSWIVLITQLMRKTMVVETVLCED